MSVVLDDNARLLVDQFLNPVVRATLNKYKNYIVSGYFTKDEITSEAELAVCLSAARWKAYCSEHEYSPLSTEYFEAYAKRRAFGAVIDEARKRDPLSRTERASLGEELASSIRVGAIHIDDAEWGKFGDQHRTPESQVIDNDILTGFLKALEPYPPATRKLMILIYWHGWEHKDIAALLDLSIYQVGKIKKDTTPAVREFMAAYR